MNDINAIRARADAATEGPWSVRTLENFGFNVVNYEGGDKFKILRVTKTPSELDAAFIAAARTDLPVLCDEVERLREENKVLRMAYTGEIAPIERFNDDTLLGDNS